MKKILAENKFFLVPFLVFLTACFILLISYSKADLHLLLNQANSPFFDSFFRHATSLGNGAVVAIAFILLLFVRFRYAFAFLIGSSIASAIVNLFKWVLLKDVYRPSSYFEIVEKAQLHLVEGVKLHSEQSFPSGHTATAFSVFFFLALIVKNNTLKFFLFIVAVTVAYSRVYISQHFLIDITAGSILAVTVMLLVFWWVNNWQKAWLDRSALPKKFRRHD